MKRFLVYITFFVLLLPIINTLTDGILYVRPLKGVYEKQELEDFTVKGWLQSDYQPMLHRYLQENYEFRPTLIRIYTQFQYWVFGNMNEHVYQGTNGTLYENWFIYNYVGKWFVGDEVIKGKVRKLKEISDTLTKLDKTLLVALAPGKASYWPEFVPAFDTATIKRNEHKAFCQYLKEDSVLHIDFNTWFAQAKDTAVNHLFPKTGTHWSTYGAGVAYDSLLSFINTNTIFNLHDVELYDLEPHSYLKNRDDFDLESTLNLFFKLDRYPLPYPKSRVIKNGDEQLHGISVISDSFFWNMFNHYPGGDEVFKYVNFWYYNDDVYTNSHHHKRRAKDIPIEAEIANSDIFVFMACTATLGKLGWGFIDEMWDHFYKQE